MQRSSRVFAVTCLATCILVGRVGAAERGSFTLDGTSASAAWRGEFVVGASPDAVSGPLATIPGLPVPPLDPLLPQCSSAVCDVVSLDVEAPDGFWSTAGGVIIQIQWPSVDAGYDLELFVYDSSGTLVAQGTTWAFSQTEAVWLPGPVPNGTYTVVIEPNTVVGQTIVPNVLTPLLYDGFAGFERGATITRDEVNNGSPYTRQFVNFSPPSVTTLLPDLVPTKPRNFHIETGAGAQYYLYMDRGVRHPPSCYPLETAGLTADDPTTASHPVRCLRWDQGEWNFGDGPFELHIYEPAFPPAALDTLSAYQRIYNSDGTTQPLHPAGEVKFSQAHGHFHYQGWQDVKLYPLNSDGTRGDTPISAGVDKGICMVDILNANFGAATRNSPHGYAVPGTCDNATHSDPKDDPGFAGQSFFQMGISVGYADLYPWFIADQYVDITNVPDGRYEMVIRQDVDHQIIEKDTTNNESFGCVEIVGDKADDVVCAPY